MAKRALFIVAVALIAGCAVKRTVPTAEQEMIYTVSKGDTVEKIARVSGLSPEEILEYNQIGNPRSLKVGQIIKIPAVGPLEAQDFMRASLRETGARKISISHVSGYVGALSFPVHGSLYTSPFGWRGRRFHEGTDFGAPEGTPIYAAHDGIVVLESSSHGNYGRIVVVQGDKLLTVYGHNSRNRVAQGDRVRKGEHIADVGATGRATGPHLHFETRVLDPQGRYSAVDPYIFFVKLGAQP
jgi:murein DD-endopeptidase MepM/ murein hydrolase activator NlpD